MKKAIKTGDKTTNKLYEAVRDYIEKRNGKVIVIGGVAVVEENLKFNYGLMVRITGLKPEINNKSQKSL